MKNFFINVILFIALAIAFSSLTGCPTPTPTTEKSSTENQNSNKPETKEGTVFPPVPSAIAQTEYKMLDGTTFKLEDQKGKVILFNLWATWCGPCRGEMPHLIEMQEKYRDKDFEIIGLDVPTEGIPESAEAITTFAKGMKLNYKLGWADGKSSNEFARLAQMPGIPISILVNRDGKMTGIFAGGGPKVIKSMEETVEKTVNE
jgi:thiol-disulfide isomerase/thioredoxin